MDLDPATQPPLVGANGYGRRISFSFTTMNTSPVPLSPGCHFGMADSDVIGHDCQIDCRRNPQPIGTRDTRWWKKFEHTRVFNGMEREQSRQR